MRINNTFNNPLYLFQSFKVKGVSAISNLINDYRTIKSGSYGKLLGAYYMTKSLVKKMTKKVIQPIIQQVK